MTTITYDRRALRIHFPGWERIMAGRPSITLPAEAVRSIDTQPGWTSEILGMRRGLVISGYLKVATFVHPDGTRRLVSMKRGLPLLRVRVDRATTGFDEALLSTSDAEAIRTRMTADALQ